MLLQETSKGALHLSNTKHHTLEQATSAESGMYYDLSNKKRMECERYQDCSWFQQDLMKGDLNKKLSLAETPESLIDPNEYDFAMQLASAQSIPWGDDYLEVFDDDILLQECFRSGDKNRILNPIYENLSYPTCKSGDESSIYDEHNFSLRKTDSFDSMKTISSTNPADIIPITYKERINNSNYGQAILTNLKNEIKEEVDLNLTTTCVTDSNENDLSIGREEVIEVEDNVLNTFALEENKKISTNLPLPVGISLNTIPSESIKEEPETEVIKSNATELEENIDNLQPSVNMGVIKNKMTEKKLHLNLTLTKESFDQSLNINTPDVDFMDLVKYINEETDHNDPSVSNPTPDISQINSPSKNCPPAKQKVVSQNGSKNFSQTINDNALKGTPTVDLKVDSTINLSQMSDLSTSIAERIKTSTKRRIQRKLNLKDTDDSESDNDSVNFDSEDDEDYSITGNSRDQRRGFSRKRSKSSTSESGSCSKKIKEESDNYRERRDKNNEASRRSRQNRKVRETLMYKTLEEEEKRNVKLKAESDVLEKQVTSLRQLLLQVVLKKSSIT